MPLCTHPHPPARGPALHRFRAEGPRGAQNPNPRWHCSQRPAAGDAQNLGMGGAASGGHRGSLCKWGMSAHMPGMGVALEGGLGEYTTSSISLIHRSMPSKDQRLVMSYTSRIPCKASEGITRSRFPRTDGVLFRLCPAALHPHMGRAGALALTHAAHGHHRQQGDKRGPQRHTWAVLENRNTNTTHRTDFHRRDHPWKGWTGTYFLAYASCVMFIF